MKVGSDGLTDKERKLCDGFLRTGNAHKSAIEAGYTHKTANNARLIMRKGRLVAYLQSHLIDEKWMASKASEAKLYILSEALELYKTRKKTLAELLSQKTIDGSEASRELVVLMRNISMSAEAILPAKVLGFINRIGSLGSESRDETLLDFVERICSKRSNGDTSILIPAKIITSKEERYNGNGSKGIEVSQRTS